MVTIIQKGADVLRKTAREISPEDIQSKEIQNIIREMREAVDSRDDAVAIAAPQLGYSMRMFMVSKKVFSLDTENEIEETDDLIFINPTLTKQSRKKVEAEEGCLSVDTWYGKTKRAEKVTLNAYNEKGEPVERGASGLLAQIFQHEVDHLNGILFVDHATDLIQLTRGKTNVPEKL